MTDWQEVVDDGQIFYVSPIGNIAKSIDGRFIAIVPATVRIGPFDTLKEAQQAVEKSIEPLKQCLESFGSSAIQRIE